MKSITFSQNSWHYKIATAGGYYPECDSKGNTSGNICEYTGAVVRSLIKHLFLVAFFIAAVTFFSFILMQVIFGLAFSFWYGVWMMSSWGEGALFIGLILSVWFLL